MLEFTSLGLPYSNPDISSKKVQGDSTRKPTPASGKVQGVVYRSLGYLKKAQQELREKQNEQRANEPSPPHTESSSPVRVNQSSPHRPESPSLVRVNEPSPPHTESSSLVGVKEPLTTRHNRHKQRNRIPKPSEETSGSSIENKAPHNPVTTRKSASTPLFNRFKNSFNPTVPPKKSFDHKVPIKPKHGAEEMGKIANDATKNGAGLPDKELLRLTAAFLHASEPNPRIVPEEKNPRHDILENVPIKPDHRVEEMGKIANYATAHADRLSDKEFLNLLRAFSAASKPNAFDD